MIKKELVLFLLLAQILSGIEAFQPDEIDQEPFLEVSDTYLKEEKLTPWFGKQHLSLNKKFTPVTSAKSLVWGESNRVIVMLEVNYDCKKCNKTRNVVFMVDTGTDSTIISPTVKKLITKDCKLKNATPGKVPIRINGRPISAKVSKDFFYYDTNILGMDFLKENEIFFSMKLNNSNRDKSELVFKFTEKQKEQ